jgi:exodeoxyribonuclease VII small subunit
MMKKLKNLSFEEAFAQLDEAVGKLEEGGLSLEESIAIFERAMALVGHCQKELDQAELKVSKLSAQSAQEEEPGESE